MLRKLPLIAAVGVVSVAMPATALSASKSHKCTSHKVAYTANGTYVSSSPSLTPSSSWTGALTIKLKSANRHFAKANNLTVKKKGLKGTDYTFTVSGAKVKVGKGVKGVTSRDHITVQGTVSEVSGKCTSTTPTITVKTITVSK